MIAGPFWFHECPWRRRPPARPSSDSLSKPNQDGLRAVIRWASRRERITHQDATPKSIRQM